MNGLLYRKVQFYSQDQPSLQFLLLQNYRKQGMKACHNDIGHLGLGRSLDLLKDKFYWVGMFTDMEAISRPVIDVYTLRVNHRKQNYIPLLALIH